MAEPSLLQLSKPDRILNPHNSKEMKMISTLWRARGLLGKFKSDEALFKAVQNAMNNKNLSLGKALDLVFGKGNYKGLPLDYKKTGSSRTGDRNITEVFFNPRKVQQVIPLNVRDWVAQREKDGTFERAGIKPGILDRMEARNRKGLTRLQKETRRLGKLYGIPFEMGHLTAIANLGTDNPANLFPELKSENRSHGAREDPLDSQTQQELGWGGGHWQDLMELIQEEGGNPAVFGVRSDQYTIGDQGNIARMGANPDQIGFKRRDVILLNTLSKLERELEQANKEGNLLQYVDNINARINEKGYQSLAPELKPQPQGEILAVNPSDEVLNNLGWTKGSGDGSGHLLSGASYDKFASSLDPTAPTIPAAERSVLLAKDINYRKENVPKPGFNERVRMKRLGYIWDEDKWDFVMPEQDLNPVQTGIDTAHDLSVQGWHWAVDNYTGGLYGQARNLYNFGQNVFNKKPLAAAGNLLNMQTTSIERLPQNNNLLSSSN